MGEGILGRFRCIVSFGTSHSLRRVAPPPSASVGCLEDQCMSLVRAPTHEPAPGPAAVAGSPIAEAGHHCAGDCAAHLLSAQHPAACL